MHNSLRNYNDYNKSRYSDLIFSILGGGGGGGFQHTWLLSSVTVVVEGQIGMTLCSFTTG